MTCPVHSNVMTLPASGTATGVVERFEEVAGSVFVGLFAAALFDQTMLPAISAALERTGRIRNTPWERATRSAASDQIVFLGEDADSTAEMERLKLLHRDVKGVAPDGTRYSALNPENWNWILISTFFMYRGAFAALTGEKLSAADNQALWDHVRTKTEPLQLPGRSRLIEDYAELCAYYDQMAAEKLTVTPTLIAAMETVRRAPRPPFLPAATEPLWRLARPAAGHVAAVLGYGTMHPGARRVLPIRWTRRHDLEFVALTTLFRVAYRGLPAWATDTPLARNRRRYRRLISTYQSVGLSSFAPDRPIASA
ncbi:oxygenase MpaB family protein [Nocardia arthritidis]|uniref:DUF2236 domain-containing protein n=1 Tax=Nocardia arthritidis TaxID=228602 RepID=A0A6G9YR39_9NOCA|nr:oxygenase MpaB family protein [Nocardia arthritidis]QIS15641.1 DUF2236 domain-containing protein [Nocardia arthritidis]